MKRFLLLPFLFILIFSCNKNGEIEQVGSPLDLYRSPINTFVASFIGSPKMNIIEGVQASKHRSESIGIRPEHISISDTNGTWADINEDHSELCKFLMDAMIHEGTDKLNVHKLQSLGILWCHGDDKKKAT